MVFHNVQPPPQGAPKIVFPRGDPSEMPESPLPFQREVFVNMDQLFVRLTQLTQVQEPNEEMRQFRAMLDVLRDRITKHEIVLTNVSDWAYRADLILRGHEKWGGPLDEPVRTVREVQMEATRLSSQIEHQTGRVSGVIHDLSEYKTKVDTLDRKVWRWNV